LEETTPDSLFTVSEVECLGSCGTAPMMQVNNEEYYENLSIEKVDELLSQMK
jgi:NADH:ubiquinone oxidoreductase subunit E